MTTSVIDMLRDLVAHKGYANAALLAAIRQSAVATADAEICSLLHHVLVSNRFWALTVTGQDFHAEKEMASPKDLDTLQAGFRALQEREESWLAGATEADLEKDLEGPLIPGGRCTVAAAFLQVCLHSLGHRAQCAKLLRRHGLVPPATDFILWLVDRPPARWV